MGFYWLELYNPHLHKNTTGMIKQWCNEDNSLHARSMSYLAKSKGYTPLVMFRNLQQNDPRYCCGSVSPIALLLSWFRPKKWIIFMGWDRDTYSGSTYFRKRNIPSFGENNLPDQGNAKFIGVSQMIYKFWYGICVYWERQRDGQEEIWEHTCSHTFTM